MLQLMKRVTNIHNMKIKICGLRAHKNIEALTALSPDYMGFIFYPESKRFVGKLSIYTPGIIPDGIKKVGVFVDEKKERIEELIMTYNLNTIQLHGNESPELCDYFHRQGIEVIKAFGISGADDFNPCDAYNEKCSLFLFDTRTRNHGGSGRKFNWLILDSYQETTPFFLSGGIGQDDTELIKQIKHQYFAGIDINSCFESEPGIKDVEKIKEFFKNLKYENQIII